MLFLLCFSWENGWHLWRADDDILPLRGAGINFDGAASKYPQTDFADSFFPHWKFLATELREGRFPLWYPFDFGGTRAPETGLFGLYYPPRIILLLALGPVHGHCG